MQATPTRTGRIALLAVFFLVGGAVWFLFPRQPHLHGRWTDPVAVKVTLHRFELPTDRESFSLVQGATFDERTLRQQEVASVTLTPEQTTRLKRALVSGRPWKAAACHDPHHVFVFRAADDSVVAVAEVCFACTSVRMLPETTDGQLPDFPALARLTDELGQWLNHQLPLDEWLEKEEAANAPSPEPDGSRAEQ